MLDIYKTILIYVVTIFCVKSIKCCGSTLPGTEGNVSHPEYPQDYGSNAACEWSTTARERDKVIFTFQLLDIEADRNGGCSYDYVSIKFEDDDEPEKYCGLDADTSGMNKEGDGNPTIKFVSDDSVQHKGFLITYLIERFDYCQSEPCLNDGTCVLDDEQEDGWRCDCVSGWTGKVCDEDADECAEEPCQNGGTCSTPEFDMYSCECPQGYTGDDCETNIDECESTPCQHGATCTDDLNQYLCDCTSAYTGVHCETEIDECESNPCESGGTCFDEVGSFHCRCVEGFEGDRCETNINECASDPCINGGTCEDEVNNFKCLCVAGYSGNRCETEIEECASDPCHHGATCVEQVNGYQCICANGYSGDFCEIELDECDSDPCQNQAPCVDHPGSYECLCPRGYVGVNCESDPCESSPCQHSGSCVYTDDGYTCECIEGYTGNHCETEVGQSSPAPETTKPDIHDPPTKLPKDDEESLDSKPDSDECMSRPCLNNGLCEEHIGYFSCTCENGFTGKTCENNINDCMPQPCLNGGSCIDEIAGFKCMCRDGYNGSICEDSTEADWHNQTHLLSAILPSILFLIIAGILALLFFAYVRRRRGVENRVNVVNVKPAATKHTKHSIGGVPRKPKENRRKKTRRFSGSLRYDIDSDVISVAENDHIQKIRPAAFVGRMPENYQEQIMVAPHHYRKYREMKQPTSTIIGNVMANPPMMQTGMFQPFPQHIYGYSHNNMQVIPNQNMHLPQASHYDNYYNRGFTNRYRKYSRLERKQLSFSSRQCNSPDSDDDLQSSTTETTLPKQKSYKNKKHVKLPSEHDTTESRVGSGNTSQDDVTNLDDDTEYHQQEKSVPTKSQDKPVHWQERDNKKLHNFPSQHRYYPTGKNLGPTASVPIQKQPSTMQENETRSQPPKTDFHSIKPKHEEPARHGLKRERTFFPKLTRQKTSFKKSSMISPGLRSNFHKKKSPKRKTLDTAVGLSPIREESHSNISTFKSPEEREKSVRFERHPPEGGVGSDPDSQRSEKNDSREEKKSPSRVSDDLPFFKLIRSKKQMSINRGRGFTRENAFVQDM